MTDTCKCAFSLVELSIVLVILGLLTGGILGGQSLIRAAELRGVTTDFQRFHSAFHTFQDKYLAIPGDMQNATSFWTSLGGDGYNSTCQANFATGTATCNGNGDGDIGNNSVAWGERFRAWQHLANAALIEGSYTGRDGSTTQGDELDANFNRPGINIPRARVNNTNYVIAWRGASSGDINWFDEAGDYNLIALQGTSSQPLKPEEAWNIDTKLDDGRPAYGRITASKSTGTWMPNCTTTGVSSTSEYRLNYTSLACGIFYGIK